MNFYQRDKDESLLFGEFDPIADEESEGKMKDIVINFSWFIPLPSTIQSLVSYAEEGERLGLDFVLLFSHIP